VLRRPLPPRALWPQLAIAMLCVGILFPFLMALAVQTVDASHGGVVLGILPIATALVAVAITHERPRPLFWIASVAGAALVIAFALRQGGGALSSGDLLLFAAVAVSAIGYAFSGRLTSQMPGWEVISWVLVIALPVSLPAAALTMPADITHIAVKPWLALLYVALFSQWIGFFAWNAGMAMGGIARVSQVQLLQPFVTFVLAASSTTRPLRCKSCCSPPPWWQPSQFPHVPADRRTYRHKRLHRWRRLRNRIGTRLNWRRRDRPAPDSRQSTPPGFFATGWREATPLRSSDGRA
jgi:hypothetical protein